MTNQSHILTETAALRLGLVDVAGNSREHTATYREISDAAESSHDSLDAAYAAAHESRDSTDRWIVDSAGDTHYVAGSYESRRI